VVFPSDIFKITNPATTYDVLYQVDGKPVPPFEVSLSPKLGITIGTNGALIRDYWLGNNIALKVGDQYIMKVTVQAALRRPRVTGKFLVSRIRARRKHSTEEYNFVLRLSLTRGRTPQPWARFA
jgi:hypothetical protein